MGLGLIKRKWTLRSTSFFFSGADDGIWTRDLYITNVVLYRLSYDSKTLYWLYGNFKKMSTLLLSFLKKEATDLVTSFLLGVYLKDCPPGFLLEGLCLLR